MYLEVKEKKYYPHLILFIRIIKTMKNSLRMAKGIMVNGVREKAKIVDLIQSKIVHGFTTGGYLVKFPELRTATILRVKRSIYKMLAKDFSDTLLNEWLKVLRRLWLAYDKKIDNEQFEVYATELGDVPIGILEPAIKTIINDGNRAPYFPRLSELKASISYEVKKDITSGELDPDNIDEWCRHREHNYMASCTWSRK